MWQGSGSAPYNLAQLIASFIGLGLQNLHPMAPGLGIGRTLDKSHYTYQPKVYQPQILSGSPNSKHEYLFFGF